MKNFKKINLLLAIFLIFVVVLESLSLPVLAYESSNVDLGKIEAAAAPDNKKDYVEGEILVKYKDTKINLDTSSGRTAALNFNNSKSLVKKEDLRKNNIAVLSIKDAATVEQKVAELKSNPNVEYVEPNYRRHFATINTNDTNRNLLWGLDNTGQTVNGMSGTSDADIDAPEAWTINEGTNASIVVAVIDSGVAYNHPDLAANMWNGTNCKDENGNALGGCNHGYDYEDGDKTPLPTSSSHGTHVAGIVAAVKNNNQGIIGVAPNAKIMALKIDMTVSEIIKAIDFAIQNGAKVINASYGGSDFSQSEYDAISRFKTAGGIFVVAAGNDATNNDGGTHFYPSDYDVDNIISVAATDQNDNLASFSNYGTTSVDVGAPGANIYSTVSGSTMNGTSALNETFEGVTPPNVPNNWVKGGLGNNWGAFALGGGNVLYGDITYPYSPNADTTIASSTFNLGNNTTGAVMDFWTKCDTEYITDGWADYMQLEYSANGVDFSPAADPYYVSNELLRWDESKLDDLNGENRPDHTGGAVFHYADIPIPAQYLTSNFKFRFRWVTDASDNNYDGCLVDDVKINKYSDGLDAGYAYSDGTSMAAPQVAGLAALIEGYNPTLTSTQVNSTILNTGDDIPALHGKTSAGTRINAYKALSFLTPTTHTISGTIKYYDETKTVPNATVTLKDDSDTEITTTTDSNGAYEFPAVPDGGNYVVSVGKDDNSIKGLSSADQNAIGMSIVGRGTPFTIYQKIAGDVNNSKSLTSADQNLIGMFLVGRVNTLTSGNWKFYASDVELTENNYLTEGLTRNYNNLSADTLDQDFTGVKMGDVNDSWNNN